MCESDNEKELIKKVRDSIDFEIQKRMVLLMEWVNRNQPDMYDKIISETDEDLID